MDKTTNNEDIVKQLYDQVQEIKNSINQVSYDINTIKTKLSMPNGIAQIRNALFYLPNYPQDYISSFMVNNQNYWDINDLVIIDKYLPLNANIIDIGANIGSYSIYWAIEKYAKRIYAFEPFPTTFSTLLTNINLNHLNKIIKPYNIGLYSETTRANLNDFNTCNIGGTSFKSDKNGLYLFKTLDSFKFKEKINLIKIDVEGLEVEVLKGAEKTIKKHKPIIVFESFNYQNEMDSLLTEYGYKLIEKVGNQDFIYSYNN